MRLACFLLLLVLVARGVPAAEIVSIDVQRSQGVINVVAELQIDAPRELVFATLSDYDGLADLSTRFKESRSEILADGTQHIYTRVEGCILFFCHSVERHAALETVANEEILATVDPARSDFEKGIERWVLTSNARGTRVVYTHELVPKFWVPPVIGVWAIRRELQADALSAARKIEFMARQRRAEAADELLQP